jgi:hypothetical protein
LHEVHPELANLKAFPKMGHIDFTLGSQSGDGFLKFLFETMERFNPEKIATTEAAVDHNTVRQRMKK